MGRVAHFCMAVAATAVLTFSGAQAAPESPWLAGESLTMPARYEIVRLNYDLTAVREQRAAVPAVFATALPSGLGELRDVRLKKRSFIRLVLPLILESNNRIQAKREHLQALARKPVLRNVDRAWLAELAGDYDLDPETPELIEELLLRVDTVPVSLAIAQSITESGWGTSRFARNGRALYGQRTWSRGGGLVPKLRREGENYEVKAFRSLLESVEAYMRNLNTHPAYEDLRFIRAEYRAMGKRASGYALAAGLDRYAETGMQYVEELRMLMRVNRLSDFEAAVLDTGAGRVAWLNRPSF